MMEISFLFLFVFLSAHSEAQKNIYPHLWVRLSFFVLFRQQEPREVEKRLAKAYLLIHEYSVHKQWL